MRLALDTFCEVYDLLRPFAKEEFWDASTVITNPDAIYVVGREQMRLHSKIIRAWTQQGTKVVFSNPHEGSDTLRHHVSQYKIQDLILEKKILLIGGGDMDPDWPCLSYDSFLPKMLGYKENVAIMSRSNEIFDVKNKPYKFLFLNGRERSHRRYLLDRWQNSGLLDSALWTCLEGLSIKYLPPQYEVDRYQHRVDAIKQGPLVKYDLFNHEWGEVYIKSEPYVDTYFSVVTETVHEYPYSFRTEKIWKPIIIGHPWIAVANRGFYRDLKNLGFQTFDTLIDESFDLIDNNDIRLNRVAEIVEDLVKQDLVSFLDAARDICKYNQEHYTIMHQRIQQEFPNQFLQFLRKHQWMT